MNKFKKLYLLIMLCTLWPSMAQRLISTSPAITQTLVSLNLSSSIVAISSYCKFDKEVPRIGTSFSPNWERVLKLKPDYLLMQKVNDSSNLNKTKKLGLNIKEYEFLNLKTLRMSILAMGKDFKVETKDLVGKLDTNIQLIKKNKLNKKILALVNLNQKMGSVVSVTAVGRNNYYNDLLSLSNSHNVVKSEGYPILSIEKVLKMDIDYIFIFSPQLGKETEEAFRKITNKKLVTWRDYESQEVGSLFIKFMRSYYEKLSTLM